MAKQSSQKALRLLLLPISTRRALIYCEPTSHSIPYAEQSYLDRGVNKAATTWASWETAESTGNWKKRLTHYGNNLLRRIPFEEWGLKSIPSLSAARKEEYKREAESFKVHLQYPGLYQGLFKESAFEVCKRLATERQGFHSTKLWQSVVIMPFTIPFALVPVIPNLPFLYLLFRAYSHYRALNGSRHLEHLGANDLIVPKPSKALDSLYTAGLWHSSLEDSRTGREPTEQQSQAVIRLVQQQMQTRRERASESDTKPMHTESSPLPESSTQPSSDKPSLASSTEQGDGEEVMLLKGWNAKLIAERLKLPELEVEIERAVEQVERDLQKKEKQ